MTHERDPRKLRDYGLGDSTETVIGAPRVVGAPILDGTCPNCKCRTFFMIEADVRHPLLRGEVGVGRYLGCPACPWASPMLSTAQARADEAAAPPTEKT